MSKNRFFIFMALLFISCFALVSCSDKKSLELDYSFTNTQDLYSVNEQGDALLKGTVDLLFVLDRAEGHC